MSDGERMDYRDTKFTLASCVGLFVLECACIFLA